MPYKRHVISLVALAIALPIAAADNPEPAKDAGFSSRTLIAGCISSAAIVGGTIYAIMSHRTAKMSKAQADLKNAMGAATQRAEENDNKFRRAQQSFHTAYQCQKEAEQSEKFAKEERNRAFDDLRTERRWSAAHQARAKKAEDQLAQELQKGRTLARDLEAAEAARQRILDEMMAARTTATSAKNNAQASNILADQEARNIQTLQQRLNVAEEDAARLQRLLNQRKSETHLLAQMDASRAAAVNAIESTRREVNRLRLQLAALNVQPEQEEKSEEKESEVGVAPLGMHECGICFDAFSSTELIKLHEPVAGDQTRHQACVDCLVGYGLIGIDRKDAKGRPTSLYVRNEQPSPDKTRPSRADDSVWIPVMEPAKCFCCRTKLTEQHITYMQNQANIFAAENKARKD